MLAAPCIVCGRIADQPTRGAACEPCWTTIRFITPPYCVSLRRAVAFSPHADLAWTRDNARPSCRDRAAHRCAAHRPVVDAGPRARPLRRHAARSGARAEVRRAAVDRAASRRAAARAVRGRARRCRRRRAGAAAPPSRVEPRLQPGRRHRARARPAGVAFRCAARGTRRRNRRWPPRRAGQRAGARSRCGASRGAAGDASACPAPASCWWTT